ncbi:GntR family transcriptional regulator [Spirochaeta dissipatitropha]
MSTFRKPETIYEQIADSLELAILDGQPAENMRVASVREAASELEVNVNTVVKSYTLLEERMVLRKERGLGYFVAEGACGRIRQRRKAQFFQEQIPLLLKEMEKLDISFTELRESLEQS